MSTNNSNKWTEVISPKSSLFSFDITELLKYKDLIGLFVYRDFATEYKQTILGPLWFIIKPVITTVIFVIVFNRLGNLGTDNIPPFLFYMSGLVVWKYFEECVKKTSVTFINNAHIFGKVYFPRLTVPISVIISTMISFGIQFIIFLSFFCYFLFNTNASFQIHWEVICMIPFLIILMAGLGLGMGIIVSSLTIKYRDLRHAIDFIIQLMMFLSPVILSMTQVSNSNFVKYLIYANPMTGIIETFRYAFFGIETFNPFLLIYSIVFTIIVLVSGVFIFNKVERTFMDTI